MPVVAPELVSELEEINKAMAAIAVKAADGTITDEERGKFEEHRTKAAEVRARFEAKAKDQAIIDDAAKVADFLDKPQYRIEHNADGGKETRHKLLQAGWDIKDGMIHAPVEYKGHQTVAIYPEHVLLDDAQMKDEFTGQGVDLDPVSFSYLQQVRKTFEPGYRKALEKYLRLAVKLNDGAMAFGRLEGSEQKALAESQDTAGGFLVPPDIQAMMLVRLADKAVMRGMCMVVPTSRDLVTWPRVQGKASQGSIYSSGFVGSMVGETPSQTDIDPAFGQFQVSVKKARTFTKVANDFIADAVVNVLGWLASNGTENLALVEDNEFIQGDGSGLHPKGVINGGQPTVDVGDTTANYRIANTAAAQQSAPKILDLIYALPPQYWGNAKMLMHHQTEKAIRKLVDAQNRYLYTPYTSGAYSGTPGALNIEGHPVSISQFMTKVDTGAAQNTTGIVYGDFSYYLIVVRTQMSVVFLRERFADTDQTGIVIFDRFGGDSWNDDAFRLGQVQT